MGRPRSAIWESDDGLVYIRSHRRGYLVVDTRGAGREVLRRELADALSVAGELTGTAPAGTELTFFELAGRYFEHGLPRWEKSRGVALTANTVEDRKGRIRNYYAFVGSTPLSQLPTDVLYRAASELRERRPHASLSLTRKVVRDGANVIEFGRQQGLIPVDRAFPAPPPMLRSERVDRSNFSGQEKRALPTHRQVHRLARAAAERSGAEYMRLFVWLLAYVGFRQGELCAIEVDDVVDGKRLSLKITKKVVYRAGVGVVVENYAKGYTHRTVVVPRLLEDALRARVAEVRQADGTLLFPKWNTRRSARETHIEYSGLKGLFNRAGADAGLAVLTWSKETTRVGADGKTFHYKPKPQSLEYTIHDLRAFAATAMTEPRRGLALRGMGMTIEATARQLGDTVDTVKRYYLGMSDGHTAMLDREVP